MEMESVREEVRFPREGALLSTKNFAWPLARFSAKWRRAAGPARASKRWPFANGVRDLALVSAVTAAV